MLPSSPPLLFSKETLKRHRTRSLSLFDPQDPLVLTIESHLLDRLNDFNKTFQKSLCLGFRTQALPTWSLSPQNTTALITKASSLIERPHSDLVYDEEFLPFSPHQFDLILSALHLHTMNDLPGALTQLHQALKPKGLFMAAFLGGHSLKELHHSFMNAELSLKKSVSGRFAPLIDVKDAALLLKRAGFKNAISDTHSYTFSYPSPSTLLMHLKSLGETNSLYARHKGLSSPKLFKMAFDTYEKEKGVYVLTFDVIFVTGWY